MNTKNIVVKNNQSGQILLVVLLIMMVGLTVGLYSVSRTTTDIALTTTTTESSIAFNAAEAGIEEALRDLGQADATAKPLAAGAAYTVDSVDLGAVADTVYPLTKQPATPVGEVFTIWLVPHTDSTGQLQIAKNVSFDDNTIDICFTSAATTPALAVTLFYVDMASGNIRASYTGIDPTAGRSPNFLSTQGQLGQCATDYNYRGRINANTDFEINIAAAGQNIPIALRIRPLYAATSIGLYSQPGHPFPKQGNDITSTGTVGEVTRKINVQELYGAPPVFMDYVLYSKNGSLTK